MVITGDLDLQDAQIARPVAITNSYVKGKIDFSRSHFASGVSLSRSQISDSFDGSGMSVGGNQELGRTLVGQQVNLIGATVDGFGHFANLATHQSVMDSSRFRHDLILDNAALTHDPEIGRKYPCGEVSLPDAGPNVLCGHLMIVEGRLGIGGRVAPDDIYLALPDIDETRRQDWLERAPKYEPQAYIHLASVLAAQGDREGAADIQYAARERDLQAAWENRRYGTAAFLLSLRWLGNYAIGDKTWWCIVPILVFATSGAFVIRSVPGARARGMAWLFGAGLHDLLPYRPIDHTIADFLDRQEGFRAWHKLVLFVFALFGIVLALFLAAAAAGLTQRG